MIDLLKKGEEILARALANGGDLAEIYFEERALSSITVEDRKVEKVVSGTEVGAGVRLLVGERTLYAHTNDVTIRGFLEAAEAVAGGAMAARKNYTFQFAPECVGVPVLRPVTDVPMAEKLKQVIEAEKAARALDPRIVQVAIRYADSLRRIVILNSEGRFVEEMRPQILLAAHVVAAADGIIQTGYHAVGGALGWELLDAEDPIEVARRAARQACLMLEADQAPMGRMPVVLSAEGGGTMIHEAVGHGLEADHIDKDMSKYCGRLGEEIAVSLVTVVDDGTLSGKRGTCCVDDEGTPTQRTMLIDQGRLVGFMHDLKTARKMGQAPTGNGRRQSYEHKPVPRMTNTMLLSGHADPKDLLASVERGLLVRKMGGGQVNTLNGDFVFEVAEGYHIRHGKAETPVRGATLIGNGPDVLTLIEGVGNDFGFGVGTCGKDGQGVPVSDAQPTIRIRELTVGGTAY
jgi:TldD protein